jgi:hypothetical protein
MPSVACPHCRRVITTDPYARLPPWCLGCGADLRPGEDIRPAAPAAPPPAPPVPGQAGPAAEVRAGEPPFAVVAPAPVLMPICQPLRYIEGRETVSWTRGGHRYRLYPTETDLLVLNLGPEREPPNQAVIAGAVFGGALGALAVSALVGHNPRRCPAAERAKQLDLADEMALRVYAEESGGSFPLSADDVDSIQIEAPSVWGRFFGGNHEALLTLSRLRRHKLTLKLLTFADVWRAVEDLPRLFGTAVANKLPWGRERGGDKPA